MLHCTLGNDGGHLSLFIGRLMYYKNNQQLETYNSHRCDLFSAYKHCCLDMCDIINIWITYLKYVIIPK